MVCALRGDETVNMVSGLRIIIIIIINVSFFNAEMIEEQFAHRRC